MPRSRLPPSFNPRRWDPHMPATRIRRWKSVALAASAVLVGLTAPAAATRDLGRGHADRRRGAYDDTYYKDAVGKTGREPEVVAAHDHQRPRPKISYDQVWDALKVTDQDPANSTNVILLYSGVSREQGPQRRRHGRLEPGARVGQVPRRLRHGDRARHRPPPPAPRGRDGQQHPRQQGLRQRRQRGRRRRRQPHRRRLLRAARRGQGRRRPHDPLHGRALRRRRRLRRPGAQRQGRQRQRPRHRQALRPEAVERRGPAGRLREAPQPGHLRHGSSTTATRSSTTRSGWTRSGSHCYG